jgi:hypothetical protein
VCKLKQVQQRERFFKTFILPCLDAIFLVRLYCLKQNIPALGGGLMNNATGN